MISAEAFAFRCGGYLVREGDHFLEIQRHCGPPDAEEVWVADIVTRKRIHPDFWYRETTREQVPVRRWTYNIGRRKFVRQLHFRNGILEKIEKLGYGY